MMSTRIQNLLRAGLALAALLAVNACDEIPVSNDTEAPTVDIASPGPNSTATDSLLVTVNAQDNVAMGKVELYISGRTMPLAVDTDAPYDFVVPLAEIAPGVRQFYATAIDAAGNSASTAPVNFTSNRTPGLRFLGRLAIAGTVVDVAAAGNIAVVAAGDGGVVAVDISNVYVPTWAGNFKTGNPIQGVAISDPVVYAGAGDGSVLALTTSTPDTLIRTANLVVSGIQAGQLDVVNNMLSVACGGGGLLQLSASQADTLIELGRYDQGQDVRDVETVGSIAYVAEFGYGLRVIDASVPDSMSAIGNYAAVGATDIYISGTTLFLARGNSGIEAISVANPTSPTNLDIYPAGAGIVNGVKGDGFWLYAAKGDEGVEVLSIANPANLTQATGGTFNTIGFANKVAAHQGYVLVADNEYLTILKYVP